MKQATHTSPGPYGPAVDFNRTDWLLHLALKNGATKIRDKFGNTWALNKVDDLGHLMGVINTNLCQYGAGFYYGTLSVEQLHAIHGNLSLLKSELAQKGLK